MKFTVQVLNLQDMWVLNSKSSAFRKAWEHCRTAVLGWAGTAGARKEGRRDSWSDSSGMSAEPTYGREPEKYSHGILQELFIEQNANSVEGKASRGEMALQATPNVQHYSLSLATVQGKGSRQVIHS